MFFTIRSRALPSTVARLIALLALLVLPGRAHGDGYPLPLHNADSWGQLPFQVITDIETVFRDSGFLEAVDAAGTMAEQIAQGEVPTVDDLAGVVDGSVQEVVDGAVSQATQAAQLLDSIDVADLERLFASLQATFVEPQEFAFSIPGGRAVFRRNQLDASLVAMVAGPAGTRVTLGMSNGPQLGGNPAERFANPTQQATLFADFALGYSNLQVRRPLLPVATPISIAATTYFKIHDDWVQLRLAGLDPESVRVKLSFAIGVTAGFNFKLKAEVEGQVLVELEVKPNEVAALMAEITDILADGLGSTSTSTLQAAPAAVGTVLVQVFDHLQLARDQGRELGSFSFSLATDAGLGVGIYDTGISLASVGAQFQVGIPLESMFALTGTQLAATIESGLAASSQLDSLMMAMSEGRLDATELDIQVGAFRLVAEDFAKSLLDSYATTLQDIEVGFEAGIYALGDIGQVAAQAVPLLVVKVDLPVGQMLAQGIDSIPTFVEGVSDTATAAAWLAEFALSAGIEASNSVSLGQIIGGVGFIQPPTEIPPFVQRPRGLPPTPPTPAEWEALAAGIVDDVNVSIQFGALGLEGLSMGNTVRLIAGSAEISGTIFAAAVQAAVEYNEKPLVDALRAAPAQIGAGAFDLLIFNLQRVGIFYDNTLGASGAIAAEGSIGLGGSFGFQANLKASLGLMIADSPHYDEPEGTLLVGIDVPVEVSASAGVSLGEGVEFTAEGGFTVGQSLANLTLKDWGQDIPIPAGQRVAGFELIDFVGEHRQDGTTEGRGWLVLPQGGIVRADAFALDSGGRVVSGAWSGVIELGPFGTINLVSGTIAETGLAGRFDYSPYAFFPEMGALQTDFRLRSDGLLFGTARGNLNFGGFALADVRLTFLETGFFSGTTRFRLGEASYDGNLTMLVAGHPFTELEGRAQIAGINTDLDLVLSFGGANGSVTVNVLGQPIAIGVYSESDGMLVGSTTANVTTPWGPLLSSDLTLDRTGVHGSGRIVLLGSEFRSDNLRVQPDGRLTGSFRGQLVAGGVTFPPSTLEIQGDRLRGALTLDIAGHEAVEILLEVGPGGITATFANDLQLFGAGRAEAWLEIREQIAVFGFLDPALFTPIEGLLRDELLASIAGARSILDQGRSDLDAHRERLVQFDVELVRLEGEIRAEMETARATAEALVLDLEGQVAAANQQLNEAINALIGVSGNLAAELARLEEAFRVAAVALNALRAEVDRTSREIAALDAWYNRLDLGGKVFHALGYGIQRAAKEAYRAGVQVSVLAAQKTYDDAWKALQDIRRELSNATLLVQARDEKDRALAAAEALYEDAKADLDDIITFIANPKLHPRYVAAALGRDAILLFIDGLERLVNVTDAVLGEVAGLVAFLDANGPSALVKVNSVQFSSTLAELNAGRAQVTVDAVIAGKRQYFTMGYDFRTGNNVGYAAAAVRLLPKDVQPSLAWKRSPWTGDADTGLAPNLTLWAYRFNATGTTTVNGVQVTGLPGVLPSVGGRFSTQGLDAAFANDANSLTAGSGGSAVLARDFLYNGRPARVTFEGLTPGTTYVATFFSVGFDLNATRVSTFSGLDGDMAIDQNQYGNDAGIRIEHTFTPTATSYTVTIQPAEAASFHLYALALSTQGSSGQKFEDWNAGALRTRALDPALGGKLADADGDGIPNLLEYALRGDPLAANRTGFGPPERVVRPDSTQAWQITFPYQASARDLVYIVQHSANLGTWTEVYRLDLAKGTTSQVGGVDASADSTAQVITLSVTNPGLLGDTGLWRLVVEPPAVPTIPNASFELDAFNVFPGYVGPNGGAITGWTGSGTVGLNPAAGSPFADNGLVPDGLQVAFIQSSGNQERLLATTITGLSPGVTYRVSFRANSRAATGAPSASWSLDGNAFVPFVASPAVGAGRAYHLVTGSFTATSSTASLRLRNQTAGDTTVIVDHFRIEPE